MKLSRNTSQNMATHLTRYSVRLRLVLAAFGLLTITAAQAETAQYAMPPVGTEGSLAYVQVSSAKLRAQAETSAPVLAKPVTNTVVKIIAKTADWCEVDVLPSDASTPNKVVNPAELQHGFIACNLLSSQAMTLARVEAQIAQKPDAKTLLDLYARAFWIAPSLARWEQFGIALQVTYLDEATRSKEIEKQKPLRYKVPEFEAMKQKLAAGITVDATTYKPVLAWASDDPRLAYSHVQPAQSRVKLPVINPSFFKANEIPVIVPSAKFGSDNLRATEVIDNLSVSNRVSLHAVVTEPSSYALHPDMPVLVDDNSWRLVYVSTPFDVIIGIWDAGRLHVTYDSGAILHGVSARGEPTAKEVASIDKYYGSDIGCGLYPIQIDGFSVKNYAPATSAIISWAGKPIPGGATARAKIKSRRFSGDSEYDLVITHEIDLDKDGVPDFLLWQGRYQAQVSAEGIWEAVYANIDGQWRLLDYSEDADCT